MERIEALVQELDLFDGIREEELSSMLRCLGGTVRRFPKGSFIFLEGEDVDCVGVVAEGAVEMIKEDVWGEKTILLDMGRGEVFGESFVCVPGGGSIVSFQAAQESVVLLLGFRKVLHTCSSACVFHQRLVENMVRLLARKNVLLMEKMEILAKKTMRERILCWLSQQVQREGSRRFASRLGRVALADYLCVDRSALTRELSRMRDEGLLDYDRNTFELLS